MSSSEVQRSDKRRPSKPRADGNSSGAPEGKPHRPKEKDAHREQSRDHRPSEGHREHREHREREHKDANREQRSEHREHRERDREGHGHREHKEGSSRSHGEGHRERDPKREHRERDSAAPERPREHREHREHRSHRESASGEARPEAARDGKSHKANAGPNDEAWLDSLIADCNDKKSSDNAPPPPREKIPKRPASRADSRPKGDFDSAPAPHVEAAHAPVPEKPSRPPDSEKKRPPPVPTADHAATRKTRPAAKDAPPPDHISDEEIEGDDKAAHAGHNSVGSKTAAAPTPLKNVLSTATPKGNLPISPTAAQIEEEITVEAPASRKRPPKDTKDDDEIEEDVAYDDDFEEASEDEEYKPKIQAVPQVAAMPEVNKPYVSIRPDSAQRSSRAPSPQLQSAGAMADIRKAMENEKKKAQAQTSASQGHQYTGPSSGQKGILSEYQSTMPKFNFNTGSSKTQKAAYNRLRDLKKMKIKDRWTVEKMDLFQQRPQTAHTLFLSGKSLKYCNLHSVSCQTGDDDVETGTMTDDIWTDEKEVQFPTLDMKSGELLPFLRRTLPLFEAAMSESLRRQGQPGTHQITGQQSAADAQAPSCQMRCALSQSLLNRTIGGSASISDVTVCPNWYGADHSLVLYTWAWSNKPLPEAGKVLDAFMRPLQSMMGLYPLTSSFGSADGVAEHPARCLYSFCRLTSIAVISDRPHLIVAGSEMGSLLVWDLRNKPVAPFSHSTSASEPDQLRVEGQEADQGVSHFESPIWLGSTFSTDMLSFSMQEGKQDLSENDDGSDRRRAVADDIAQVHNTEICCVRCSEVVGHDSLIFALDLMGTVTFWRVLEIALVHTTQVKLALQGQIRLADDTHSLCNFLDASYLCIHPQQQMTCVVVSASGLHQAHRQRSGSVADGPRTLALAGNLGEEFEGCAPQPCSAAFNPFLPGLLVAAYAEGDLALFDCAIGVPIIHWANVITRSPNRLVSVAWSPCRPCVFFVQSGDALDVWDLAQRTFAPVLNIDLKTMAGSIAMQGDKDSGYAVCNTLYVTSRGQPIAAHRGVVFVVSLPPAFTVPLSTLPPAYAHAERTIDSLVVGGSENTSVFPTLERYCREIDVPPACALERDLLRRILASSHPLQAWT